MTETTLKNLQFLNQTQVPPWKMPGVKFRPTDKEIFTYFLPRKILFGSSSFPPSHYDYTQYVDLYGNLSPKELFLDSQETNFYCFSSLKSHNGSKKRFSRVAGGGTWDGDGNTKKLIDGIYVGTMKSFKFKFSKENSAKDDRHTSWILHEYAIDEKYLVRYHNAPSDINVDKIVFCHIHKKSNDEIDCSRQKRKGDSYLLLKQVINKKAFYGNVKTTTPFSTLETMNQIETETTKLIDNTATLVSALESTTVAKEAKSKDDDNVTNFDFVAFKPFDDCDLRFLRDVETTVSPFSAIETTTVNQIETETTKLIGNTFTLDSTLETTTVAKETKSKDDDVANSDFKAYQPFNDCDLRSATPFAAPENTTVDQIETKTTKLIGNTVTLVSALKATTVTKETKSKDDDVANSDFEAYLPFDDDCNLRVLCDFSDSNNFVSLEDI